MEPVLVGTHAGSSGGYSAYQVADAGSSSGYRGSSGSRYEYDLSNSADRGRYSIDLDAQRRDQMSVDVGRNLDRLRGQQGGGFLTD